MCMVIIVNVHVQRFLSIPESGREREREKEREFSKAELSNHGW